MQCLGELLGWWRAFGPEFAAGALVLLLGLYLEPPFTARIRRLAPVAATAARRISVVLTYAAGLAVAFTLSGRFPLAVDILTLAAGITFGLGVGSAFRQVASEKGPAAATMSRRGTLFIWLAIISIFAGTRLQWALVRYELIDYGRAISAALLVIELTGFMWLALVLRAGARLLGMPHPNQEGVTRTQAERPRAVASQEGSGTRPDPQSATPDIDEAKPNRRGE